MSAHTAGPWEWVDPDDDTVWDGEYLRYASLRTVEEFGVSETKVIDGKNYTSFALPKFITDAENIGGDEESNANARLIAAAPELLEALNAVANEFVSSRSSNIDRAFAAIAKATGAA